MKAVAHLKGFRVSPQKARLVADLIRGKRINMALNILSEQNKKSAPVIKKVLESAIANAKHNHHLAIDRLKVSAIYVNPGPHYKRMQARAKGRGTRILKPTSHITIQVAEL